MHGANCLPLVHSPKRKLVELPYPFTTNEYHMKQVDKGMRAGNFIIDIIVLTVIIELFVVVIGSFYRELVDSNSPALEVLTASIFFLYYFLFELFTGKTIGKMLTKTIVVDKYGSKPKVLNLIARSLTRLILIEAITFIFGPIGLHDLISGTRVIKGKVREKERDDDAV